MREARERVFRPRFRIPNHARDAPQPLRINFGEIENLRFRNFGTGSEIWARPCPSLGLSCVHSAHMGGALSFFLWNLPEINGF